MSLIHLNQASAGAPRNSGTNGDLVTLLDWALVTNGGWTIDKTATNARVYLPVSGNGFRLYVNHDSAVSGAATLATVRGCETATAASEAGVTNPFPTIAEIAATSATWCVSSAASTTSRNFDIYVTPSFMMYFSNINGLVAWDVGMFGDFSAAITGDVYNTLCSTRNSAATAAIGMQCTSNGAAGTNTRIWVCRSYDGTVKSVAAAIPSYNPSGLGLLTGASAALVGSTGLIDRRKVVVCDTGATTATFSTTKGTLNRGWIPQLWEPLHNGQGTVNAQDTFTDTAYNGSATFRVFSQAVGGAWCIVEETDTWSAPSG